MKKLEPPAQRYTTGKHPTHSSTLKLASNFQGLPHAALVTIMSTKGLMSPDGKPTKEALSSGLMDQCERAALWNLSKVKDYLHSVGVPAKRQYANQELPDPPANGSPSWVNLSTIATYFNVTAGTIGKWLDKEGLREPDGLPNKDSLDRGIGNISEMRAGPKKTRKIPQWNLHSVLSILKGAGHPLDFDYDATLKGKGKNSDVKVSTIEDRAKDFTKSFIKKFNARDQTLISDVNKAPKALQVRAEELMKKPGLITSGNYKKRLR